MNVQGLRGNSIGEAPRRQMTLNERLNKALDRIETVGDRIERALGRVNGTPIKESGGETAVQPIRNLLAVVEGIEAQSERFRNLSEGVDLIA